MDFSRLEPIDKKIHIISAIERAAAFGGDIWQTDLCDERSIFQIVKMQVDSHKDRIVFHLNSLTEVQQSYPIFIRLRYRNIIFRFEPNEFKVLPDNKIVCSFPHDVKALAMRTTDRYVLPFELDISMSIKLFARTIKEVSPELEVRMIDVSQNGIGILISNANKDYFRPYDHFWIKAIDHRSLTRDIFGTVLYVAPKGYYLRKQDVRIGLSLSTSLSWDTFDKLKKKCKTVLTA